MAYLAERRANAIAEHGLRDRAVTDVLLSRFAHTAAGAPPYRIEAAFLTTPSAQSQLGILMRYQVGLERAGIGRYVSKDLHDARYHHALQAARWLEADPRVTANAVYRRGDAWTSLRAAADVPAGWGCPSAHARSPAATAAMSRPSAAAA